MLDDLTGIFGISKSDGHEITAVLKVGNINLRPAMQISAFEDPAARIGQLISAILRDIALDRKVILRRIRINYKVGLHEISNR